MSTVVPASHGETREAEIEILLVQKNIARKAGCEALDGRGRVIKRRPDSVFELDIISLTYKIAEAEKRTS
jgi:hypothetical protein